MSSDVTTANSYVFDVFRVGGGTMHTYCFHAMVNDEFVWNARDVKPIEHVPAKNGTTPAEYLSIFEAIKKAGSTDTDKPHAKSGVIEMETMVAFVLIPNSWLDPILAIPIAFALEKLCRRR